LSQTWRPSLLGCSCTNHEASGIRRRVHGNYLIFYRVKVQTIEILRVLHAAMDYERLMFPQDE